MTDDPKAEKEGEPDPLPARPGAQHPFLTVVARAPLVLVDGLPAPLLELLASTRRLLLFPADQDSTRPGVDAELRAYLGEGATVVLLPPGPRGSTFAEEPGLWLERALDLSGRRKDATGRIAVLVTESLVVLVPDAREPHHLEALCDLQVDDFTGAWNQHLVQLASAARLAPVVDVVPGPTEDEPSAVRGAKGTPEPTAQHVAELQRVVRELKHERQVLRENRDLALAEHLNEVRVHREQHAQMRKELETCHLELELRARMLDEVQGAVVEHELRIKRDQTQLQELESLVRRTRAARIAKWLDRSSALRRMLTGGSSAHPTKPQDRP